MRHRTGYGYKPPKPRFTDRNGRPAIDDFPIAPETPIDIRVHALAANQPAHTSSTEGHNAALQPNPPQPPPEIPVTRELQIPTHPTEAIESGATEPDFEAEAASLLARLHATDRCMEPARPRQLRQPAKKRRRKSRARKSKSLAPRPSNLSPRDHHERFCSICNHPDRDAIEEEFIHWHSPYDIAHAFDIEARSIYRHAHALGLFRQRDRAVRHALGLIIEQASRVEASADSVIRAVHAFTRVNDDGQWVDPPTHVVVSSGSRVPPPTSIAAATTVLEIPAPGTPAASTGAASPDAKPENLLVTDVE